MKKRLIGVLMGLAIGVLLCAGYANATGNIVPITDSTETLGTSSKLWGVGYIDYLSLQNADTIKNTTDDTFDFASNDSDTILRLVGYENSYAQITLDADEGDDNADSFHIRATTANALEMYNHTTKIWSLSSAGAVNSVGGIDCDEDVDIDFDATDEEFNLTTSTNAYAAGAGVMTLYVSEDANGDNSAYILRLAHKNDGGANNEFILCEDNSTGAAGNGDDMFAVNADGGVVAAGTVDAAAFTVDAGAGLDNQAAGALLLGASTATSVEIADSGVTTDIQGPVTVLGTTGAGIDTAAGNAMYIAESTATSLLLGATDCPTTISGAMGLKYANKTANYTSTVNDCVVSYDTSAVTTNTLPEASTALGKTFIVCLQDDDGDLVVMTDGTDKFDGSNDILTFADAGDSCGVMATAANVYTILWNVGGTLSN